VGASLLITLREGLEISLVLAILAAYLVKSGRPEALRPMWVGAAAAMIVCLIAGVAFHLIVGEFEGKSEQAIEGVLAASAALVLTWMIFWMRKNARGMSSELRARLDAAGTPTSVALIAFVATAREGFETVLFLLSAETGSSSGFVVVLGGLIGIAFAAVLGVIVYRGGRRFDLATFFTVTGTLLIFFAAGLVGKAFHEFRELFGFESGRLIAPPVWEITSGSLAEGTLHDFLNGMFGWSSDPEPIRVIAYLGYLVPVLWVFLAGNRRQRTTVTSSPSSDRAVDEATAQSVSTAADR
jgi:high-affinity iron transporter